MNIHAPVMLYHKAVLIGLSEFPSFLRYIFSKAAKNAEFNPQKIPKFNQPDFTGSNKKIEHRGKKKNL